VIVPAPAASVDCNVYDRGADTNLKQSRCRVACHTNVVRRGTIVDDERHVLRIDARDVDATDSPIDGGSKLPARTMDSDLPDAAVDFNFVLHEC
jgi:hypothetical protein